MSEDAYYTASEVRGILARFQGDDLVLARALKYADRELVQLFFDSLPEARARKIAAEIESMPALSLTEMEEAQQMVMAGFTRELSSGSSIEYEPHSRNLDLHKELQKAQPSRFTRKEIQTIASASDPELLAAALLNFSDSEIQYFYSALPDELNAMLQEHGRFLANHVNRVKCIEFGAAVYLDKIDFLRDEGLIANH